MGMDKPRLHLHPAPPRQDTTRSPTTSQDESEVTMPNPPTVIGTVVCPVDGCDQKLDVVGKTYTEVESGMVGLSVKPSATALEHMNTHRERRANG